MRRGIALLVMGLLVAVSRCSVAAGEDGGSTVKLTLLKVWASKKAGPESLPKDLKKYEKLLKAKPKTKKFNAFRLQDKPIERKVPPGKKTEFPLPDSYTLAITRLKEKTEKNNCWLLKFTKKKSKVPWESNIKIRLKEEKPSVILMPIRRGDEHFVMILLLEPTAKKRPAKKK